MSNTTPRSPRKATAKADATLIALCARLCVIDDEMHVIYDALAAADIDSADNKDLDRLMDEIDTIIHRIAHDLPEPTTLDGLRAMSRAARTLALKDADGSLSYPVGHAEWLAFQVARAFVEGSMRTLPSDAAQVAPHGTASDAELIAIGREAAPLVAEFDRCTAAFFALPEGDPGIYQAGDAGDESFYRLEELADRAALLRAETLDGLAAKALLLRHLMMLEFGERHVFVSDGLPLTDLTWTLVRDLLNLGTGGAA